MPLRPSHLLLLSAFGAALAVGGTPASAGLTGIPVALASAALGDLAPFRAIAADTLALVDKGDIPAARTRVKDLETAWDKAEPSLKARDKATWTTVDGMIDSALTDLRTPNPRPAVCQASLKALLGEMDRLDKA